jgi:Cu(I)/Ag(I) efflux system membrane protein CusA/SilA
MVREALMAANQETGGSVLELAEAEYMVRASGYLKTLEDFRAVPLACCRRAGALGDVATCSSAPRCAAASPSWTARARCRRRGGAALGQERAAAIAAVKARLEALQGSLPPGVEVVPVYDRSALIERAIDNLGTSWSRSSSSSRWSARLPVAPALGAGGHHRLPLGVLAAFIVMRWQGINANIMSLGGIAIAIGAMVDAAMVMIENAHKHSSLAARARREPAKARSAGA